MKGRIIKPVKYNEQTQAIQDVVDALAETAIPSLTGNANKFLKVNSDASVIEFVDSSGYDGNPETITQDATHLFHTAVQEAGWDAKVDTDDSRLSDARTPTTHTHDYAATNHNHDDTYSPLGHTHPYEPVKGVDDFYVNAAEKIKISNTSGSNTGDETTATIKAKLSITTLSGSNTGDQDLSSLALKATTITINGTTYDLSANRSWTVTAAPPDIAQTKLSQTTNQTIATGYGAISPGSYKITDGTFLKIENGAHFKII
jgi:hypothetical protein